MEAVGAVVVEAVAVAEDAVATGITGPLVEASVAEAEAMVAEVDVVLPMSFQLKEAHDLGEIITYCIESITGIERAYIVRIDSWR